MANTQFSTDGPAGEQTVAGALATELRGVIAGEVRFDSGSRALYSTDASNYRQVPIGVVVPRTVDDIVETVAVSRRHQAPILMRGGGTSLAGQTCNVAVVLDTSKYLNRVLTLDPQARTAEVEPGVVCDVLRDAAETHGLTFGPDPSTHSRCTLGGMIGNNACGAHSVMAGKTAENIEALEILTYDGLRMRVGPTPEPELEAIIHEGGRKGEIYAGLKALRDRYADAIRAQFPKIRRRVSGFNLEELLPENGFNVARALVGTEGTCVVTLSATARLVPSPRHRVLLVLGYADICVAADHAPKLVEQGALCVEGLDENIINDMRKKGMELGAIRLLPGGDAWLMVEFGGETREEALDRAQAALAGQRTIGALTGGEVFADPRDQRVVWSIRENGAAATNAVPGEPESYPGWEDAAVDPEQVGDYLRDYRKLLERYGYRSSLYGHFGDGCIHGRVTFDLHSEQGLAQWRAFMEEATDLVVKYGGSLSGEHGDGQARAELLPRMYSAEIMQAFREFKAIWDPHNRMNPGKLVDPYRLDENLRTGPDYRPADPPTVMSFYRDEGSFAKAAGRCVGAGKCRRHEGGVMCPSYRATREERDSTRGRARMLFEMVQGDPLSGGWDDPHVKESLDLCLSCKSCRAECPVQVDMASYKAEFLHHYHQHHRRPPQAYTIGLIHQWARIAGRLPWLVNALTRAPGISRLLKAVAGIAPQRSIPLFRRPFNRSFRAQVRDAANRGKVVLWPDTFNNHFHPQTLDAAVKVLNAAGFGVEVPRGFVCCGRPLYDFGMLDSARHRLEHSMRVLANAIDADTPVIGLEPACVATFRDELLNFFPDDKRARRLSELVFLLPEFLEKQGGYFKGMQGKALVHGHCHQKAVMGMGSTESVLCDAGLDVTMLDAGCCGMAGAFGFDVEKYEVSMSIGEERLLPAVRGAADETLIIADGYSCREQVFQATGRLPLHSAEVLLRALEGSGASE
ncbi:MAG: FAD-binding and (Fe-S)-binding domain-containing protein [Acidihalobacter sp.]|uniref:FAD-binding and (Fe-S)-binding domain-containing protein n=1 Tax=Acidihalobacter sp. TaxID=1872108 RepID=UPI00307FCE15